MSHERPAESAGQSNPSHTDRLIEEYARADISELREQLSGYIGFALLVIGGTIAWATLTCLLGSDLGGAHFRPAKARAHTIAAGAAVGAKHRHGPVCQSYC